MKKKGLCQGLVEINCNVKYILSAIATVLTINPRTRVRLSEHELCYCDVMFFLFLPLLSGNAGPG